MTNRNFHAASSGKSMDAREILDVKDMAESLRCSKSHVTNILMGKLASKGLPPIPHIRAGRRRLVRLSVLIAWLEDQERASVQPPMEETR